MLEVIVGKGNYWIIIALMMTGLYITYAATNLIKRMVGLSIFQTSVFLFYITLSKVAGGTAPVLHGRDYPKTSGPKTSGHETSGSDAASYALGDGANGGEAMAAPVSDTAHGGGYGSDYALQEVYSNPLPHVLILTAIVVGVATLSVGLAIIVRVRETYHTIEADEIRQIDLETAQAEEAAQDGASGAPA